MDDLEGKLIDCFTVVFPDLAAGEVRLASIASVPGWDSMASINLVAVIEEEFGIQLEIEELADMASFASVLDLLQQKKT